MQHHPDPVRAVLTPTMPVAFANGIPDFNKINMDIRGDQVLLSGLLDLKGLRLLPKRIERLEALLTPDDDENAIVVLGEAITEAKAN